VTRPARGGTRAGRQDEGLGGKQALCLCRHPGEPGAKRRPPADTSALRLPALSALLATLLCTFTNCERDASDAGELG
jgi:hypothetical protein